MGLCMRGILVDAKYVIVSKEIVLALDLLQTLTEFDATASVTLTHSVAEAMTTFENPNSAITVAFVHGGTTGMSVDELLASDFSRSVRGAGGRIVLMGADEVSADQIWLMPLPMPFTTEAVLHVLNRIADV